MLHYICSTLGTPYSHGNIIDGKIAIALIGIIKNRSAAVMNAAKKGFHLFGLLDDADLISV